jgi:signal transduction histidine kinase
MAIRFKILLGCLAFIALTVAFGGFARLQQAQLGTLATDVYDNALVAVTYVQKVQTDFVRLSGSERLAGKPFRSKASREQLEDLLQDLDVAAEQAMSPKARLAAGRVRQKLVSLEKPMPRARVNGRLDEIDADLGKLVRRYGTDSFVYRVRVDKVIEQTQSWFVAAVAMAGVLAILITAALGQTIVPPINRAVAVASAIAEGKLDNRIEERGRSETARLLRALKAMQASIAESARRAEALRAAETARLSAEYETEAARQASQAKSEFLATMSHELRTPLNAILGFSEVIEQQMFGPVSAQYAGYARDIHASGRHLLELINDILDLSKLEAGKVELHDEEVAVAALVDECVLLVRDQATRAGVALSVAGVSAFSVRADRRCLKQVLLNLLSNAIKFTPTGRNIAIATRIAGTGSRIEIVDRGIGMTPAEIEVALSPFGQVDSRVARQHKGTGLGLPISRSIMQLHGGDLNLESTPGVGTTAIAELPLERVIAAPVRASVV